MRVPLTGLVLLGLLAGCTPVPSPTYNAPGPYGLPPVVGNPVFVPVSNPDFAWDQIVDVVDDYFKVEREQRVLVAGDSAIEGRIDTYPQTAATLLEPWREDSVTGYDRLEATLQSLRRRAFVRVMPASGGYLVEVSVIKELEDLPRPENATTGGQTFRHDNSMQRYTQTRGDLADAQQGRTKPVNGEPRVQQPTIGWIPQGRDIILENTILSKIQSRLGVVAQPMMAQPGLVSPY